MCVKLHPEHLNSGPYFLHPTNISTCGVTIAPNVCGGNKTQQLKLYSLIKL